MTGKKKKKACHLHFQNACSGIARRNPEVALNFFFRHQQLDLNHKLRVQSKALNHCPLALYVLKWDA
jgi:hypothetical protein